MIIAKIVQDGQVITLEDALKTFQYSANLQMQFIRDDRYKDYVLVGYYKHLKGVEYLLDIDKDGIFNLNKDIFAKNGSVYFSFSLNNPADGEIIHLGVIEYTVEQSFGSGDAILPEEQDTWIQVVSRVVEDQVSRIWNKDYKPQLEQNLNIIEAKTEEIKTSAMEVKQDALESSANAKSALDNANLAKESASGAILAKEKALEHMSNAEGFKNDASNYASQADLAKTEASKSATDASNSVSNALTNANKAKEHLTNIVEKTNAFNADYTNKVNNFNTSVENANNTLDAKISTANTSLDKKIVDANGVIDAKVTDATEQANIATDKATELSQAVDKVNYLEDALDTKLTQPYVSSDVIENATISDSDEGLLRNLKIYGKCTQKVEENIVPTPDRPVPIVSKKIVVSGETVELRSLKESSNLFDIKLNGFMYGLLDMYGNLNTANKNYASTDFIKVLPNTQYYSDVFGTNIISSGIFFFDINKEIVSKTDTRPFVTPSGCYYVRCGITINGTTLLEDLSIANNAFVFCKGGAVNTYIQPTVRDYKIVDHVNKRSWIERNVGVKTYTGSLVFSDWVPTQHRIIINIPRKTSGTVGAPNVMCNIAYPQTGGIDLKDALWETGGIPLYWHPNITAFGLNGTETKADASAKLNEFLAKTPMLIQYELAEPVTEEIEYLESDTSEFGISSQDSTSPSPTIKSEIEKVTEINIKTCGKNLLDYTKYSSLQNVLFENGTFKLKTGAAYGFIYYRENLDSLLNKIITVSGAHTNDVVFSIKGTDENDRELNKLVQNFPYFIDTTPFKTITEFTFQLLSGAALKDIQIEEGDIATEYELYKGTAITHTLANPLLSLADGSVADSITLENRTNKLSIHTFTGKETFSGSYGEQKGYYGRYFMLSKARGNINQKVFCNVLPYYGGSWSVGQESCCQNANQLHLKFSNIRLGIRDDTPIADKQLAFSNYIKEQYDNGTPIEFLYILENPTIEPLENGLIEKLKTLMSFYPVTHIISNAPLNFDYKLNLENWHKVVSGEVEDARNIIYDLTVKQNSLEVMQLQSALETQYNLDLMKLGGGI